MGFSISIPIGAPVMISYVQIFEKMYDACKLVCGILCPGLRVNVQIIPEILGNTQDELTHVDHLNLCRPEPRHGAKDADQHP